MAVRAISQNSPFAAFGGLPPHAAPMAETRFGTAFPGRLREDKDCVPTPPEVADRMVELLDIRPGMSVLEPSAGTGNIAGRVREQAPQASLDVVEYQPRLRKQLRANGYHVVGDDFMAYNSKQYDRIIMNPPFSSKDRQPQSISHVQHAYSMLKPGGRLAAIVPAWMFSGKGRQSREFLRWLKEDSGHYAAHTLDHNTFDNEESPNVRVATRLLVINKPAEGKGKKRPKFGGLDLVA